MKIHFLSQKSPRMPAGANTKNPSTQETEVGWQSASSSKCEALSSNPHSTKNKKKQAMPFICDDYHSAAF
jgi:hypothetical protein